jgi:tRNA (guanine-N7-)-methyltransferase
LDLYDWMVGVLDRASDLFERVNDATEENDPCVKAICNDTEEGKKVKRGGFPCYFAVYRRL